MAYKNVELTKELRKAKTPAGVYRANSKILDFHYARIGVITLVSFFEKYATEAHNILAKDKWYNVRDRNNHQLSKMERKTSRALNELLDVYSSKLLNKLP